MYIERHLRQDKAVHQKTTAYTAFLQILTIWILAFVLVCGAFCSVSHAAPSPRELDALRKAFRNANKHPAPRSAKKASKPSPKGSPLDALRNAFRKADNNTHSKQSDTDTNDNDDDSIDLSAPSSAGSNRSGFVQGLLNAMNPAISALGIFAVGWSNTGSGHCHADGACFGDVGLFGHIHDPIRTGFNLQQLELTFNAAVDPYFTAAVVLSIIEGESGAEIEIEEAYMQTTSLPWRFQIKAGKFLSDTTRLGSKHLHDLDFVTVAAPLILAVGGEMRHYAVQLTWLAPLPFYLRLGAEVSYGGSITFPIQDPAYPVFVGHMRMYFDISPSTRLLIGGGIAHGIWDRAEADASDLNRTIASGHILFQWRPPERNNVLTFKWMAEYYGTWSQCDPRKVTSKRPNIRQYCLNADANQTSQQQLHGFTTKAVLRFAQQWQTGIRFDWMQQREAAANRPTHRLTGMLIFVATEFSRIRLEYNGSNFFDNNEVGHAIWLQFQFSIGAHGAHKF